MADETRDTNTNADGSITVDELKKRAASKTVASGSGSSSAQLLKGLLMWNKESYLLIDNSKHIYLQHATGSSKMSYIDGVITQESQTSTTEKTPKHYIDSPDCKVGSGASHPDTKCDGLMELLEKMALAIDAKAGKASTCTADVLSAKSAICSATVQIAD